MHVLWYIWTGHKRILLLDQDLKNIYLMVHTGLSCWFSKISSHRLLQQLSAPLAEFSGRVVSALFSSPSPGGADCCWNSCFGHTRPFSSDSSDAAVLWTIIKSTFIQLLWFSFPLNYSIFHTETCIIYAVIYIRKNVLQCKYNETFLQIHSPKKRRQNTRRRNYDRICRN